MRIPEDLRCCVCLAASSETLLKACPHRLCLSCVQAGDLQACPVCNAALPRHRPRDRAFAREAAARRLRCDCGAEVPLLKAEGHACDFTSAQAQQPGAASGRSPEPTPKNRSTFACPLCGEANLSREGLLDHCNQRHGNRQVAAVCPICVSMPWGDPLYVSQDFLSHLQLRHRCAYDVLTDFEADEETMLQRALQASIEDVQGLKPPASVADEGSAALLRRPPPAPAAAQAARASGPRLFGHCCRRRR
mmetsp:Transcript_35115/g.107999  ORF Transcript_35115/g.107999 Transcript_35115/m.107999 type:complete len:248 (+) Transcript_35115:71-814(+)